MFSILSPDSKAGQFISRLADLMVLNILYLLTCLPLFTAGAATAALYRVSFRLLREEGGGVIRPYLRSFRENFRQGTLVFLLLLVLILPSLLYFRSLLALDSAVRYLGFASLLPALLALLASGYAFSWLALFRNSLGQILRNSLILSLCHLPRSVLMLLIRLLPAAVLFISPELFANISFLWAVLYFAAAAFVNAALLLRVYKPYLEPAETP